VTLPRNQDWANVVQLLELECLSFVDLNKDKDKVELNALSKNFIKRTGESMVKLAKLESLYQDKGLKHIGSATMDQLQQNILILKEKKFEVNDPLLLFDAIENDINEQFNFLHAQEKQLAV